MKTETQIAKENVEEINRLSKEDKKVRIRSWNSVIWDYKSKEHLATCQRFLEFLEDLNETTKVDKIDLSFLGTYQYKKEDLQNAIKTYKEAGIK